VGLTKKTFWVLVTRVDLRMGGFEVFFGSPRVGVFPEFGDNSAAAEPPPPDPL
jgi:hypothetical protein